MRRLTVAEIVAATGGTTALPPDLPIPGPVVADSRQVEPGSLFVALPGEKVDGATFAAGAVADGAVAILTERSPADPGLVGLPLIRVPDTRIALGDLARWYLADLRAKRADVTVFGITGSNGKTTTKDLLGELMAGSSGADGDTIAPRGSYNSDIGLPLTLLRGGPETANFVMEFGADKPGDNTYLSSILAPQIVAVLKVGTAHIEQFGSQEAILEAKFETTASMAPGGTVVLNADDFRVASLAPRAAAKGLHTVTFGREAGAQVRALDVTLDAVGRASYRLVVTPDVTGEAIDLPVALSLVGEHHVYNSLAAAAAALVAGRPPQVIAERLGAGAASPHRMAVTERADGITVIDDAYNANPESMAAALRTLQVAGRGRRTVAVLSEMRELGAGSPAAHRAVGELTAELGVDVVIVIGEGAAEIAAGAASAQTYPDLDQARTALAGLLRAGDVVLVKASNGTGLWALGDELADGRLGPGRREEA
ncbi:MAG: UDP-N-acetylmuramoyl-tripeptide--D-alanyl-D-alanine ligase [Promicromonosporaceae bacterium]|nr:UDP-N-acetylmuramoyl-tripeptide--D-alanyl-D-alanine ligase [Promicromonosporaceae bacterium]